jgi:hypothetical protein
MVGAAFFEMSLLIFADSISEKTLETFFESFLPFFLTFQLFAVKRCMGIKTY